MTGVEPGPPHGSEAGALRAAAPRRPATSALAARLGILIVRLGFALGSLRSPRASVVLATRETGRIDGNLRSIQRELERRMPSLRVRVIGYKMRVGARGRLRSAWEAFVAGYHLAAARLFVSDDWFFPSDVVTSRAGTARVQVWHAAGAFKKFGYSVFEKTFGADEAFARLVPIHSHYDLCLVSSAAATPHYMDAFRLPRERFTSALGLPRTDVFFDADQAEQAATAVRRRYRLPLDRRILLYAPTYRGENVRAARSPDFLDLVTLRKELGEEWVVLLRVHPLVRPLQEADGLGGFVVDATDWPEMNELMLVSDLLVTDYSSAIFEFALLGRPIAFLAPDVSAYDAERGFYLDLWTDLPGPLFANTGDLARHVRAGQFDLERVRAFASKWFDVADGRATRRFVDRVVDPAVRGEPLRIESEPRPEERALAHPVRLDTSGRRSRFAADDRG